MLQFWGMKCDQKRQCINPCKNWSLAGKTGSSLTMQPGKHCHEVTEKAEWARLPNTSNREQIMKDEELGQMQ